MNPVALYFASGESLYAGAGVLLVAILMSPLVANRWLVRLRNVAAWAGLVMMLAASAPSAWWTYAVLGALFLAWYAAWNAARQPPPWWAGKGRVMATPLLVIVLAAMVTAEVRYRALPGLSGAMHDHVAVIGDSISAGIDPRAPSWPTVMRAAGYDVMNLAQPGALTADGLTMAKKLRERDALVVVEIGGNDLLANVPTAEFARDLEALLARIDTPGRMVVMFELPLLPHKIGYGRVQRELAARHHVALIPKRLFIEVLSGGDATSDGLHLSPAGAARMAELMERVLQPVLRQAAAGPASGRGTQAATSGKTAE